MTVKIEERRIVVAHGRPAMRELRLSSARALPRLQVITFDQAEARLAEGL